MTPPRITDYDSYIHEPNNRSLDHIPGDYGLPVIGHTLRLINDPFIWAQEQHRKYGFLSKISSIGTRALLAVGPDLSQQIFTDKNNDFSSRMGFLDRVAKFFPGSLIMEDFERHLHQRKILQTAFKSNELKHYTNEVNRIYDRVLQEWDADAGNTIPFFIYIKELLLEVAAEIFIGETKRGERVQKLNQAFMDCSNGTVYVFPLNLPGSALNKGLKGRAFLEQFLGELVPKKRAGDGLDMFSHFCREKDEDGNFFTDVEIVNQMMFLLFAAHDTTTAAITHTIYYLAKNPEAKEKLYQECKALGKDYLAFEDLSSLPYMQQVFNEVQRLRPSAPMLPRRTVREVEMAGYKVPAHTLIFLVPRFTHHMEEYWTEPSKFDPDRFSPERAEHKQHPFLFHPFGGGNHKCIGMHFAQMEYKCFLHKFILKYDFEAKHKKEPKMLTVPIPKPADSMPIKLIKR
jgi:cytochrome P450